MGPAHSTVVNQSTRKICIITFNNGDLLYKHYHSMFIFEPGQEGVVEANPDAVGLKIGVVYDINSKTKEFLYHRFLVKNESIFTISEVDSEEVSFFGNDIVNIGKGKVKETDNVPFQMGAAAVANKNHKVDQSTAGVYIKDHPKDEDNSKKSTDSPTSKKELKLGGLSVTVPKDMTSAMNMIKNKANEVKDKVKEKAKNVEEKIKEQVKNLDEKAKDLTKTKKEKENDERIEQERIRYEAEREAREEEERLAEEKYQQELREAEEEARLLRESEEAMMLEMQRLEQEQEEREKAEEEARKQVLEAKKSAGFFGRKKIATPSTPSIPDNQDSHSKSSPSKDSHQKSKMPSQVATKLTSVPKKSNKPEVILSADPVLHPRPRKLNPNGNRKKTSYEGAAPSIMRKTTAPHDNVDERDEMESKEVRNVRIKKRRGAFRYLPTYFANDLLHGSYWFFWGSVLAMVIPILPILSILYHLYEHVGSLNDTLYLYIYGLLIFGGLMFSIGSYHFLRVFIEPPPEPYFNYCRCISNGANDELIAGWYFFLGTAPSVPVVTFYVVYLDYSITFIIALIICSLCTLAMLIFVISCIPEEESYLHNIEEGPHQPKAGSIFAPFFQKWCCEYAFHKHLLNDWLVAGWLMFWCCMFGTVCSAGMLMYESYHLHWQGIYDWSTGLADCIMFTIGSAYLIAGSYPVAPEKATGPTNSRRYSSSYNEIANKSSSSNVNKSTTATNKKKIIEEDDDNADY